MLSYRTSRDRNINMTDTVDKLRTNIMNKIIADLYTCMNKFGKGY